MVDLSEASVPRLKLVTRCRANVAHTRQSRPDSGLGLKVKVLKYLGAGGGSLPGFLVKLLRERRTPLLLTQPEYGYF